MIADKFEVALADNLAYFVDNHPEEGRGEELIKIYMNKKLNIRYDMSENVKELIRIIVPHIKKEKGMDYSQFETDKFFYWAVEDYKYRGDKVTKEVFDQVRQYVVKHGCLPKQRGNNGTNRGLYGAEKTKSEEIMIRYSKTYKSLEMYIKTYDVRSPEKPETTDKILVMRKIRKIFSMYENGTVRVGKRWLSLKNWSSLKRHVPLKGAIVLMNSMIDAEWLKSDEIKSSNIDIQNKNSRGTKSLKEAIANECGYNPPKILYKILENPNYVVSLCKAVEGNKIHAITNFAKNNKEQLSKLLNRNWGDKGLELLWLYFLCKDNRCGRNTVVDYVKMLNKIGRKINLNISSYATIKNRHDELDREMLNMKLSNKGRRLKIAEDFPEFKSTELIECEMIKTVHRLNLESQVLKHCVHSYKDRIDRGECAIYSIVFDEKRYTLQIGRAVKTVDGVKYKVIEGEEKEDAVNTFSIRQLKGKHNKNPSENMRKPLEEFCKQNNFIGPEEGGGVMFTKESRGKRRKLIHIGEAILDKLVNDDDISAYNIEYENNLPF